MKPCQQWWGGWGGVCLSHVNWSQSTDFHWSCWCLLLSLTCSIIVNRIENLSSSSAPGHCATPCCRGLLSHLIKLWWHTVIHCKEAVKKKKKRFFPNSNFCLIVSPHFMVTLFWRNFYSVRKIQGVPVQVPLLWSLIPFLLKSERYNQPTSNFQKVILKQHQAIPPNRSQIKTNNLGSH